MTRLSVLPVLLLLLLAACATAPQGGDGSEPGAQAAAPAQALGIPGDYTVNLAEADFAAAVPAQMRGALAGTWRIAFHGNDHYVATLNGREVVQGTYRLNGNQITFEADDTGPFACGTQARVVFRVNHGNMIQFSPAGPDECDGRAAVLTTRPFVRTP
jgi:hypothetical protein